VRRVEHVSAQVPSGFLKVTFLFGLDASLGQRTCKAANLKTMQGMNATRQDRKDSDNPEEQLAVESFFHCLAIRDMPIKKMQVMHPA
jgi:hypothetical protein